jgi:methionyl-tRNA formyltransferase
MKNKDICYVSCTEGGYEVLRNLLREGIDVNEIVSLTPEQGKKYDVAGYYSMKPLGEATDTPIYYPEKYEMDTDQDVAHFRERQHDVVIVNGWQRLLRDPILQSVSIGAFGVHGSGSGLPKGRGRSPMNWSLIENLDRFLLSVIKLDSGVDSGFLVDTRKFDITDFDTIRTLYYKLAMATTEILVDSLPSICAGSIEYTRQRGDATYYPKRTPEDGAINWRNSTRDIYNLIRAVADPYPGAFTEADGERVFVWTAIPFSTDFGHNAVEGEIVQVFETTDEFVVRTGDGTMLVSDWEAPEFTPEEGFQFDSLGDDDREYVEDHA